MKIRIFPAIFFLAAVALACASVEIKPTGFTYVSFVSEPQTPEEQAVAKTMEGWLIAWNVTWNDEQDAEKHFDYFAPNGTFQVPGGGFLSKDELRKAILKNWPKRPKVELRKTKITILSADQSRVEGKTYLIHPGKTYTSSGRYDLIYREGKWIILKQQYSPPI